MSNAILFPETWEEFEADYGFTDSEEVYTNGARLIASFRVGQWLEHIGSAKHGKWMPYEFGDYHWHKCSVCGVADCYITTIDRGIYGKHDIESVRTYCPHCGARMEAE